MPNGITTDTRRMVISLDECLAQVDASKVWFARCVLPLSIEQLRWRPEPKHWSIAECLDHLNLSLGLCLPGIDEAISDAWRDGHISAATGSDPAEVAALHQVEPPVVVPALAPTAALPSASIEPERLVDHFHQVRDRYAGAIRRALGLDLYGIRVAAPIVPWIRSLGGVFAYLAAHDRRHLWQSERIRRAPRFPRAAF